MPFIVECPYCKTRARVPDRAMGASGKCVRCAGSFTLAPADDQRVPELAGVSADPSSSDLEPAATTAVGEARAEVDEVVEAIIQKSEEEFEACAAEAAERQATDITEARDAADAPVAPRLPIRPEMAAGTAALLLAGIGLLCASFRPSCGLVLPLSGLGLLFGVVGVAWAWRSRRKRRFVLPVCAFAASGFLLGVAFLSPASLGPTYARARQQQGTPAMVLHAVPLNGAPAVIVAPEWTDADKYALQRGAVRVQIVKVSLGPMPVAPGESPGPASKNVLLVRVRVQRAQVKDANDREVSAFDGTGQRRPKLTDGGDQTYELKGGEVIGSVGAKRRADLFPVTALDEVFAFDPPPGGVEFLKLELPGAQSIGGGNFRFTIPAAMIAPADVDKPLVPKNGK